MDAWQAFLALHPLLVASGLAVTVIAAGICALVAVANWEPSARAQQLLDDVHEALRRRGQLKAAAFDLGVQAVRISRWLRPTSPNILTRLADLGEEFERDFLRIRAERLQLVVIDQRLIDAVDQQRGRRRMARMEEIA